VKGASDLKKLNDNYKKAKSFQNELEQNIEEAQENFKSNIAKAQENVKNSFPFGNVLGRSDDSSRIISLALKGAYDLYKLHQNYQKVKKFQDDIEENIQNNIEDFQDGLQSLIPNPLQALTGKQEEEKEEKKGVLGSINPLKALTGKQEEEKEEKKGVFGNILG